MKTLALIVRKPEISRDAFRAHYEEVHAPLALPLLSGLVRYVRHYVQQDLHGASGFDVMTAFTYRDEAALRRVITRLASPTGDALLRDELSFMHKPQNRFFAAREVAEQGARGSAPPPLACTVLAKRAPAQREAAAFAREFARRALPDLRDAVRGLRWSLHHEALALFGEVPFDVVTQLHADAAGALEDWARAREREGARVVIVSVNERETRIPPGGVD
ncbi:MAG TPA: EthD domain-containing protein [Myxococcota bacterium]|nr:EthD domain-containing protein [Myxococcota bacterium]